MTRYERKLFFERLMTLRDAYRAEVHESSGMTIEQAIAYAERTFESAAAAEAASAATSSSNGAASTD
jgi:hypothetical protein